MLKHIRPIDLKYDRSDYIKRYLSQCKTDYMSRKSSYILDYNSDKGGAEVEHFQINGNYSTSSDEESIGYSFQNLNILPFKEQLNLSGLVLMTRHEEP